ncbi:hypothetical protein Acr_26g0009350 [Actinidia rufa]|uniref:Uncharacterized protein n=1 Tax=Actinidia rufa TaxID=165716 RepID=A0A7J0H3S2_9ERIC|nr:hypothetical protein Acr_26g0009350 [Actinidia rufa]
MQSKVSLPKRDWEPHRLSVKKAKMLESNAITASMQVSWKLGDEQKAPESEASDDLEVNLGESSFPSFKVSESR